jgi:hypothetical protein
VAALAVAAAFLWQWMIATGYFGGNWNGFFYAGDAFVQTPPVKAENSFVFKNSYGFDGQLYHASAHDPLDLHGTDRYMDLPRLRYGRILIPGLSYMLGLGRLFWVDWAYRFLELAFLFLGVACAAAYLEMQGRSCWWAIGFLAVPGVFISIERMLADLPLAALIVAALLAFERKKHFLCWLALSAACLDRDTGVVAVAALAAASLWEKRPREAALWVSAVAPYLAWSLYLRFAIPKPDVLPLGLSYPLASVFWALRHLQPYPFAPVRVHELHVLDTIAILGGLLAFAGGIWMWLREKNALAWMACAYACFGVLASSSTVISDFRDVYIFARHNSPLLLVLLLQSVRARNFLPALPMALILPRAVLPIALMSAVAVRHIIGY